MNTERLRQIRIKKHKENPKCHWCGIPTILTNVPNGILPPNGATLDHLISKISSSKGRRNNHIDKIVLSCAKCNHDRGREEALKMGKKKWTAFSKKQYHRKKAKRRRRKLKKQKHD